MEKGTGILLPIFSLPSKYGIGTFGKEAIKFIKFLKETKMKYWQLLPINPTSFGDSPYQSFSAFAINPYFIDLDLLVKDGFLTKDQCGDLNHRYSRNIDYGEIYEKKFDILRKAFNVGFDENNKKYISFVKSNKKWLDDYALFMVIKNFFNGNSFEEWPDNYRLRKPEIIDNINSKHKNELNYWKWLQFIVFSQYKRVKKYANKNGIKIIGDIPIYVALDSADVWSNYGEFELDRDRRPTLVSGVPPDYFSKTGQLWGNPLYKYSAMEKNEFKWWKFRTKTCSKLYDVLRIDHFRGMEAYWAVPSDEKTAINGKWIKGPGIKLVDAINSAANGMEIIAEDLGFLTPEVLKLKEESKWPGLSIYQFGFDSMDPKDQYLPENCVENCVAYIGTHDNDTLKNYIDTSTKLHQYMMKNLDVSNIDDIYDKMMEKIMCCKAKIVILRMQDILKESKEYRINLPGSSSANWNYRLAKDYSRDEIVNYCLKLVNESGRN